MLKELGIPYDLEDHESPIEPVEPRIIIRQARPGYVHSFGKKDIRRALEFAGPIAVYGLRSIELAQQPDRASPGLPAFGQLVIPGRIKVYEQPITPWRMPGVLPKTEVQRMERAGAVVEINDQINATFVNWTADSLREFMMFEVLFHEIGHHVLQHNTGKRTERIAGTRDHEAFASWFAERCRTAWFEAEV